MLRNALPSTPLHLVLTLKASLVFCSWRIQNIIQMFSKLQLHKPFPQSLLVETQRKRQRHGQLLSESIFTLELVRFNFLNPQTLQRTMSGYEQVRVSLRRWISNGNILLIHMTLVILRFSSHHLWQASYTHIQIHTERRWFGHSHDDLCSLW